MTKPELLKVPYSRPRKILGWLSLLFFLAALLSVLAVFISSSFTSTPHTLKTASKNIPGNSSVVPIKPAPIPAIAKKANPNPIVDPKSDWADLTPDQQKTLAPLAANWNKLKPITKNKWQEISQRYATMTSAEQTRVQQRMRDWVDLSPKERQIVRENYAKNSQLDTEQRAMRWMQYQQLSAEEKQKLAAQNISQRGAKHLITPVPIIEKSIPVKSINLIPPDPVTSPDDGLHNH